jgi:hypothetical protein
MKDAEFFSFMNFVLKKHIGPIWIYRIVIFVYEFFRKCKGSVGRFFIGAGGVGVVAIAGVFVTICINTGNQGSAGAF